ncbi:MAG: hypothetical protein RLZZ166_714 [Pseudomonadota bacterium]
MTQKDSQLDTSAASPDQADQADDLEDLEQASADDTDFDEDEPGPEAFHDGLDESAQDDQP